MREVIIESEIRWLIARLMATIETPDDLTKDEVNELLGDAQITYDALGGKGEVQNHESSNNRARWRMASQDHGRG